MPAWNEDGDVIRVLSEFLGDDLGELLGLLELRPEDLVRPHDRFVLAGHRPQLELRRIALQRGDVDVEARLHHVMKRKQHFHRVVSGGEHLAVLQQDVALLRRDHEHLPLPLGVGAPVLDPIEVGLRRRVLTERIRRREVRVVFGRVRRGGPAQLVCGLGHGDPLSLVLCGERVAPWIAVASTLRAPPRRVRPVAGGPFAGFAAARRRRAPVRIDTSHPARHPRPTRPDRCAQLPPGRALTRAFLGRLGAMVIRTARIAGIRIIEHTLDNRWWR